VGGIVYQRDLGPAGHDGMEVHLVDRRAPTWDRRGGDDLKTLQEARGVRPIVRFCVGHDHVAAVLRAPTALPEQRACSAGTRRVSQVDPQPPTGGRSLVAGAMAH
jgi:hypothetical protein